MVSASIVYTQPLANTERMIIMYIQDTQTRLSCEDDWFCRPSVEPSWPFSPSPPLVSISVSRASQGREEHQEWMVVLIEQGISSNCGSGMSQRMVECWSLEWGSRQGHRTWIVLTSKIGPGGSGMDLGTCCGRTPSCRDRAPVMSHPPCKQLVKNGWSWCMSMTSLAS